jgi:hypothetical protein
MYECCRGTTKQRETDTALVGGQTETKDDKARGEWAKKTSSGITPTFEDPEPAVTITEMVAKRAVSNRSVTYRLTSPC